MYVYVTQKRSTPKPRAPFYMYLNSFIRLTVIYLFKYNSKRYMTLNQYDKAHNAAFITVEYKFRWIQHAVCIYKLDSKWLLCKPFQHLTTSCLPYLGVFYFKRNLFIVS